MLGRVARVESPRAQFYGETPHFGWCPPRRRVRTHLWTRFLASRSSWHKNSQNSSRSTGVTQCGGNRVLHVSPCQIPILGLPRGGKPGGWSRPIHVHTGPPMTAPPIHKSITSKVKSK